MMMMMMMIIVLLCRVLVRVRRKLGQSPGSCWSS